MERISIEKRTSKTKGNNFCDSEFAMGELFSYITSQTSKRRWLTLTSLVEEKLHPRVESKVERDSLLRRFEKFKEAAFRDGIIGTDRHKHYGTVYGKLYRFLYINKKLSIRPAAIPGPLR